MSKLNIKTLLSKNPLVQAPLAGYSTAAFRSMAWKYGPPAFCCTEMISAHDLTHRTHQAKRYIHRRPTEKILCFQISGKKPDTLAQACTFLGSLNAQIIDLNCGCPVKKIRRKGSGSKLLSDPAHLFKCIQAMRNHTDAALSIKIRVGGPVPDSDDLAVVDAAEQAGVDFITVHGRHWTQKYDTPSNLEAIKKIAEHANVPIIANGDIKDIDSAELADTLSGCSGLMIARASVGQPWIFKAITQHRAGENMILPTPQQNIQLMAEHLEALIEDEGEKTAVLQSRKLAKYYARQLPNKHAFIDAMQQATTFQAALNIIQSHQ